MLDNEWKGWCKRSTMYECSSLVGRPRYLSEKAAPEKQSEKKLKCIADYTIYHIDMLTKN